MRQIFTLLLLAITGTVFGASTNTVRKSVDFNSFPGTAIYTSLPVQMLKGDNPVAEYPADYPPKDSKNRDDEKYRLTCNKGKDCRAVLTTKVEWVLSGADQYCFYSTDLRISSSGSMKRYYVISGYCTLDDSHDPWVVKRASYSKINKTTIHLNGSHFSPTDVATWLNTIQEKLPYNLQYLVEKNTSSYSLSKNGEPTITIVSDKSKNNY